MTIGSTIPAHRLVLTCMTTSHIYLSY